MDRQRAETVFAELKAVGQQMAGYSRLLNESKNTLASYINSQRGPSQAMRELKRSGCTEEVILELLRALYVEGPVIKAPHKKTRADLTDTLRTLPRDLESLGQRVKQANRYLLKWVPGELPVRSNEFELVFRTEIFEALPAVLQLYATVLKARFIYAKRVLDKANDYFWELPILAAYVVSITGNPCYPELSVLMDSVREFLRKRSWLCKSDAARKMVERYRKRHPRTSAAVGALTTEYFRSPDASHADFLDWIYERLGQSRDVD